MAKRRRAPDKAAGGISAIRISCCERFSAASNPGAARRQARCCLDRKIIQGGSTRREAGRCATRPAGPASQVPAVRHLGSKINEPTIASSGTLLHEAYGSTASLSRSVNQRLPPAASVNYRLTWPPCLTLIDAPQSPDMAPGALLTPALRAGFPCGQQRDLSGFLVTHPAPFP